MTTQLKAVARFAKALFENGLETWDPTTKTAQNLGGAKLFYALGWRNPNQPSPDGRPKVLIFDKNLYNVLVEIGATVYTASKVNLNEDGSPEQLENGRGLHRVCQGLVLYMPFDDNPRTTQHALSRILEVCPDLEGYVGIASNLAKDIPSIQVLENTTYRDFMGTDSHMKLSAAIVLAVPSGPPGSAAKWGYQSQAQSRATLSSATTASQGQDELPF
jgi:hypothetical protein